MSENKFELIIENSIVIGYEGKAKVVEIPEGVTEIGKKAFYNCKFIEEINIKSTTLKTIGESAFEGCAKIKKCKLSSLKGSVEKNAFYGCHALTHIEIPDGAIKIGPNVFGDCKSLLFVVIPPSVFIIDGLIFDADNKRTVILGETNSEAEEYSRSNVMPFKEDTVSIRNELLALEQKKNSASYKDFTIFGETVRCYQSVVIYQELLDYCKNLGKDFVQDVFDCMPRSVTQYDDDKIGKLIYLANECTEKTRVFLQQHGIFINDDTFETKVSDFKLNYINVSSTLLDTYIEIQEAISEGKLNLESTLIAEAESKITGLSYGVIGDSLTMVAYALDEYRAEKQQRKAAYAEATEKMQTGTSQIYNKAQQLFTDFMNETCIPAFEKSIHYIIEGLMEFAIEEMIQAGLIDQEIFEIYDATKSRKITEQAKNNSNIDKKYAVAMALKLYPLNIDAITIAVDLFISNNYIEKDVFALAEFLGINNNDIFSNNYSYIQLFNFYNNQKENLNNELVSFLAEFIDKTANHLICRINDGYDPADLDAETWNSLVENYTVITPENSKLFNLTEKDIKGPSGQQLLSHAIQTYNEEKQRKEYELKIAEEKRLEKERKEKEEAERLAELKQQQRKAKIKKKIKISLSLISVFLVFVIVSYTIIIPRIKFQDIIAISAGDYHTVALKSNGTVVAVGDNYDGQCDVNRWTDIIAISAGRSHTLGLKSDGTVVATGSNDYGECDVRGWTDIIAISTGWSHTLGLKSDGTVVATGSNDYGECNVNGWTDIIAISAGDYHTVALKSDGTVVAVGHNSSRQCNVNGWTDIIAISAGDCYTLGLKSDGTVVAVGDNDDGECDVNGWTDIVAISTGGRYRSHTLGLKSDGTVVAVGDIDDGQCDTGAWQDITAVSGGSQHSVGLKSDGTVVAVGRNRDGQCRVGRGW